MTLNWEQMVVDSPDPVALGTWWAAALGWEIIDVNADECEIQPRAGQTPGMIFVAVTDHKTTKNRLHIDLRPDDQTAEIQRLLLLGAVPADVGQRDVSWVVLQDPEGNEFCVLSSQPQDATAG